MDSLLCKQKLREESQEQKEEISRLLELVNRHENTIGSIREQQKSGLFDLHISFESLFQSVGANSDALVRAYKQRETLLTRELKTSRETILALESQLHQSQMSLSDSSKREARLLELNSQMMKQVKQLRQELR